ncbi:hypothetical protein VTJ49DRAFT_5590 [Mycothermus thermophilus]|uniref:Uncharacterized protein n=1 Tax=Humicola insolens TaxID=85995 RepID=A0ABR3VK84_HUMIN
MADQGAGGGIESHMSTHRRQDSGEESIPTDTAPEKRSPPAETTPETQSTPQDLPRGSRKLSQSRASQRDARTVASPPSLSRNPSTCSNNPRPQAEYLTACTSVPEQRPIQSPAPQPRILTNVPLEPPVTRATLSELDVQKIVHNPKLRHDINFDPDLHFRPNLDGEKGRRKQEKANQFWNALYEQLVMFVMDREGFEARYTRDNWCLPALLRAAREIIETLVPQRDREMLNEGLNVDLLMQQFYRGVADMEKVALWLAGLLKLHCAPMRDEWVDEMCNELSNGNRNNDVAEIVKGMRSLLNVLEAMKLDVANHQIRCLRPALIEDTIHFEQRFFLKKIESGKLSVRQAVAWYQSARESYDHSYALAPSPHAHAFGDMSVFFEALSRMMLPSTGIKAVPPTFVFDEDRILKLRSDMHDSICLEICMRKFDDLERVSRVSQLCSRLPSYVGDDARNNRSSGLLPNFMAAGGSSRPASFTFSDHSSNASSPRNSGLLFTQPDVTSEARSSASELYSSLRALLQTAPPTSSPAERWQGLAGNMAVQILRAANAPMSLLSTFEPQLLACLSNVHCDTFRQVEEHFHRRLLADLAKRVNAFKHLSCVALYSQATGGRVCGHGRRPDQSSRLTLGEQPREPRDEAGIDDMAVRLAHLGILHWRVWGPLAYEGGLEAELSTAQDTMMI